MTTPAPALTGLQKRLLKELAKKKQELDEIEQHLEYQRQRAITPPVILTAEELLQGEAEAFDAEVPEHFQVKIRAALQVMQRIKREVRKKGPFAWEICQEEAERLNLWGISKVSLMRKYRLWKEAENWRVLIPKHNGANEERVQPKEFVEFIAGLIHCPQGLSGEAARSLLLEGYWKAGKPVPGYGTKADWQARQKPKNKKKLPEQPPGWTAGNLLRLLRPKKRKPAAPTPTPKPAPAKKTAAKKPAKPAMKPELPKRPSLKERMFAPHLPPENPAGANVG